MSRLDVQIAVVVLVPSVLVETGLVLWATRNDLDDDLEDDLEDEDLDDDFPLDLAIAEEAPPKATIMERARQ